MKTTTTTNIAAADASEAEIVGEWLHAASFKELTYQVNISATAFGTVELEGSNDLPTILTSPLNIAVIPEGALVTNGGTSYLSPKIEVCYNWIRSKYKRISGTGIVSVVLTRKHY